MIGRVANPPFALLPDPAALFAQRAERFRVLAEGHALAPYLLFLAGLCDAQAGLARDLPPAEPIAAEQRERARAHKMPPLDRAGLPASPALAEVVRRFLEAVAPLPMPAPAAAALEALRKAEPAALEAMLGHVVADSVPLEALPEHLFLSAATQVQAARLAASLGEEKLQPIETGTCPCCGGPPVSSRVVGWHGAEGVRYAACAFCGTQWNEVRIKCLACGTTKGIGYKQAEGAGEDATVKAETCDSCRSWVKILYQDRNPALEPVADDVASLGLDMLMQQTEYRRAGFDPFLIGY